MSGEPCAECGMPRDTPLEVLAKMEIAYHPFVPAPETVEAQARWERAEGNDVGVWVHVGCATDHEEWVPPALEAAIRAPLEESRQRLTDAFCEVWLEEVARLRAAEERIRELERARDQVREALPKMLEMAGGGEFLTGLWAQRLLDSHNRAKSAEAENAKLREAIRDWGDLFEATLQGTGVPVLRMGRVEEE